MHEDRNRDRRRGDSTPIRCTHLALTRAGKARSEPLLTVRDVAGRLGIGRSQVYELINSGQMESVAIGRVRRVSPASLAEFISKPAEPPLCAPAQPELRNPKQAQSPNLLHRTRMASCQRVDRLRSQPTPISGR